MSADTSLGSRRLAQIAFVVADIEAAKRRWALLLGVDPPPTIETGPGLQLNQTYRGVPSDARVKLAFFELENIQIELIEPIGEDSAWYEGLQAGEGVHHIAFWTENMTDSARHLRALGGELIHRGDMGDGQFAYFDTKAPFGTMVELLERQRTPIESQ